MNLATAFLVVISVVLVNNFIFSRFLGYCPYIGVSTEKKSALGALNLSQHQGLSQ